MGAFYKCSALTTINIASGSKLTVDDLPVEMTSGRLPSPVSRPLAASTTLAEGEKEHILAAIDHCHGNISKAADELGISRRTIHRKLKEWKISR